MTTIATSNLRFVEEINDRGDSIVVAYEGSNQLTWGYDEKHCLEGLAWKEYYRNGGKSILSRFD